MFHCGLSVSVLADTGLQSEQTKLSGDSNKSDLHTADGDEVEVFTVLEEEANNFKQTSVVPVVKSSSKMLSSLTGMLND